MTAPSSVKNSLAAAALALCAAAAGCSSGDGNFPADADSCTGPGCDGDPGDFPGPEAEADDGVSCDPAQCQARCEALGYASSRCNASLSCSCLSSPPEGDETCGDGLDNNGNGGIDEGCPCSMDRTQACYSGPPATRGVGPCRDGLQICQGMMEFYHWGPCLDQIVPEPESCDHLDSDCDGMIDEEAGCAWSCTAGQFPFEFDCLDGVDEDCDGLIDCYDPDCSCCVPSAENCANGLDDDCDTLADCRDTDCTCCTPQPENCFNGRDDDCDGKADCADPADCVVTPAPEECDNDIDDDCDGQTDCDDAFCCSQTACSLLPSCTRLQCCYPAQERWCDYPAFCSWGKQTCLPDGRWGICEETADRIPGCEPFYYDLDCCTAAGECCQNWPVDDTSLGRCSGIATLCP